MDWLQIQENVGKNAKFFVNGEYINIKIKNAHTLEDGKNWFTYSFLDHKELSPIFLGYNLNYANCCWSDINRGYFSKEIKNSLVLAE